MLHYKKFNGQHAIMRLGMFLTGHRIEKYQLETMKDGQIKVWFDSPSWVKVEKFLPPQDVYNLQKHSINVTFRYIKNGETLSTNGYYDYETKTWYANAHDGFGPITEPLEEEANVIEWLA